MKYVPTANGLKKYQMAKTYTQNVPFRGIQKYAYVPKLGFLVCKSGNLVAHRE
jgi:hypothetical protein